MTVEVVSFPQSIFPSMHRLSPSVGGGQSFDEGPFSNAQNVITYYGAERWRLEMSFNGLTGDERAEMLSFVTRLRVSRNVFLCVNHAANNRGVFSGTPRAVGSAAGQSLVIYGANNSVSSWARAGDFVAVNCQLKMVLQDAGTSAGGVCSLYVWPPVTLPPNSGTLVVVSSPAGGWRLVQEPSVVTEPPGFISNVVLSAVERINSSYVSDVL